MINISSFVIGVVTALVIILLITLVVMVLKIKRKVEDLKKEISYLNASMTNIFSSLKQLDEKYDREINEKERELYRQLNEKEKNCISYTDSRIDKSFKK